MRYKKFAQPTQLLSKDWRYALRHPKDLIISNVSQGVSIRSKLQDICVCFAFISYIEPKNIHDAKVDSYVTCYAREAQSIRA